MPNYWLNLFTAKSWKEFQDAGASVTGFNESRWSTVKKVEVGDRLLCYLAGVSRFVGVLEVVGAPYKDATKVWEDAVFPCRLKVKAISVLEPETGVPIKDLAGKLSFMPALPKDTSWSGHVRGSPTKWKAGDGKTVEAAISNANANPISKPVSDAKLKYRPVALRAKLGQSFVQVTIPGLDGKDESDESEPQSNEHTEIQYKLLTLGADMGFDVWVAKNDRSKIYIGKKLGSLPKMRAELPLQFDDATNRTIELIDVLWLRGNQFVAAFEIESTTSIYSGLLRMADLVAMQPNLNLPLYIVAPEARREKVMTEVNRPTFSRLTPKLNAICRYIPFDGMRVKIAKVEGVIKYLKAEFLEELSESCELDD